MVQEQASSSEEGVTRVQAYRAIGELKELVTKAYEEL